MILENWYSPISPLQAEFCSLDEKLLTTQLFETGVETPLKTRFIFGESSPSNICKAK
jgi:hypothetical protein